MHDKTSIYICIEQSCCELHVELLFHVRVIAEVNNHLVDIDLCCTELVMLQTSFCTEHPFCVQTTPT